MTKQASYAVLVLRLETHAHADSQTERWEQLRGSKSQNTLLFSFTLWDQHSYSEL